MGIAWDADVPESLTANVLCFGFGPSANYGRGISNACIKQDIRKLERRQNFVSQSFSLVKHLAEIGTI